jgi:hypothetical protein
MSNASFSVANVSIDLRPVMMVRDQWCRVWEGFRCGISIFHLWHPQSYATVAIDEITLLAPHPQDDPSVRRLKVELWTLLQDAAIKYGHDDRTAEFVFTSSTPDFFRLEIGSCLMLLVVI